MTTTLDPDRRHAPAAAPALSVRRLHALRVGYLVVALGLALVKWPLLPDASMLPLFEGVTLSLLTALSLLAFLGLRHPERLLPVLLLEMLWKVVWLGLVALPRALSDSMDAGTSDVVVSCSVIVVVVAVVPWGHVWRTYLRGPGERWR